MITVGARNFRPPRPHRAAANDRAGRCDNRRARPAGRLRVDRRPAHPAPAQAARGLWSRPAALRMLLVRYRRWRRRRWAETVQALQQKQARGDLNLEEDQSASGSRRPTSYRSRSGRGWATRREAAAFRCRRLSDARARAQLPEDIPLEDALECRPVWRSSCVLLRDARPTTMDSMRSSVGIGCGSSCRCRQPASTIATAGRPVREGMAGGRYHFLGAMGAVGSRADRDRRSPAQLQLQHAERGKSFGDLTTTAFDLHRAALDASTSRAHFAGHRARGRSRLTLSLWHLDRSGHRYAASPPAASGS